MSRALSFVFIAAMMVVYTVFALTIKTPLRFLSWVDERVERAIDWLIK